MTTPVYKKMAAVWCLSVWILRTPLNVLKRQISSFNAHTSGKNLVLISYRVCNRCNYSDCQPKRDYSSRPSRKFPAKDLYAVLDVSPFATQSQIKEAYYKLSMKYHPDQNQGNKETETLFKELTDAYSVLGKTSSRHNYDKGLLRDYPVPHHIREMKHRRSTAASSSKKPLRKYNFDEFNRGHYGDILRRSREFEQRRKEEANVVRRVTNPSNHLYVVPAVLMFFLWYVGYHSNVNSSR